MSAFAARIGIDTPIALTDLLHLDALLGRVVTDDGGDIDDLPLARTDGMWHASAALLETGPFGAVSAEQQRIKSIRKGQFPDGVLDHLPPGKRTIGAMSAFRGRITPYRPMSGVTALWFVFDGDPVAVADLLDDVLFFGAYHKVGYGRRASDVEIFPVTAQAPAGVVLANGLPARATPMRIWDDVFELPHHPRRSVASASWRPDYRLSMREACAVPSQVDMMGMRSEIMGLIGA